MEVATRIPRIRADNAKRGPANNRGKGLYSGDDIVYARNRDGCLIQDPVGLSIR